MMEIDKDKRLSAEDCLKHPWFGKVTDPCAVSKTALTKALDNLITFKVIIVLTLDSVEAPVCDLDVSCECSCDKRGKEGVAEDIPTP